MKAKYTQPLLGMVTFLNSLMISSPCCHGNTGSAWQFAFPLAAIAVVAALFVLRDRIGRGPLVAVLFYAGTLFPALGFFSFEPTFDIFPNARFVRSFDRK